MIIMVMKMIVTIKLWLLMMITGDAVENYTADWVRGGRRGDGGHGSIYSIYTF